MKTIIWDVDDVLNDLMRDWFVRSWLPSHPGALPAYPGISENPPDRILGCERADYLRSLDEFRQTDFAGLSPDPDVAKWFGSHGHLCRHLALTAVPLSAAPASAAWVLQHFGRWIRSFNVVPSPRENDGSPPAYFKTKKDFLGWLGQPDVILVDDSEAHISEARSIGITGFLMPRPWNSNPETIPQTLDRLTSLLREEGAVTAPFHEPLP